MQTTLICPFRTLVNLNTDVAFTHADDLFQILERAVQAASKSTGSQYFTKKSTPEERAYVKYTNLDIDHNTWASTPLSDVEIRSDDVQEIESIVREEVGSPPDVLQRISGINLLIFDNTIAVATIKIDVSFARADLYFETPASMEQHFTMFSAGVCRVLQKRYVEVFLRALDSAARSGWKEKMQLLRKPKQFVAFDDLSEHPYPKWLDTRDSMVWSHRIFDMTTADQKDRKNLETFLRTVDFLPQQLYHIKWGNSYILKGEMADKLVEINVLAQYFFTLFDLLGHSQKRLLRRISSGGKKISFNESSSHYDRLEHLISEAHNDFLDYRSGIQGVSADVFIDTNISFGTGDLISTLETRSSMLKSRLKRIASAKLQTLQRLISFVLIVVGGTQIVSLVLDLLLYSGAKADDNIPGILDLATMVPPDLALNVCIAALLIGGGLWALISQRRR